MIDSRLSFGQSLMLSLNGLIVVFTVLVILALATILIARIIGAFEKQKPAPAPVSAPAVSAPAAAPAAPAEEDLGDVVAVLQGALSLETGIPVDQLEIVSIRSVPDSKQS